MLLLVQYILYLNYIQCFKNKKHDIENYLIELNNYIKENPVLLYNNLD